LLPSEEQDGGDDQQRNQMSRRQNFHNRPLLNESAFGVGLGYG
jgi:hypothetical protein